MKDFSKKLISALTALAMTASMLVYAEAPSSVENDEENAQPEVVEAVDSAAHGVFVSTVMGTCIHDPSASTTVSPTTYVGHHKVDGKTCMIHQYTITTTTVCKKCGITISSSSETHEMHSVCGGK